jgi:hypothetical protein
VNLGLRQRGAPGSPSDGEVQSPGYWHIGRDWPSLMALSSTDPQMPLQLTVHHGLPYLLVEVFGVAQLVDHRGIVELIACICADTGCRKCLLDMRSMQADLSFTEQLQLGTRIGEKLSNLQKVAIVVGPNLKKGVSLKVAKKLGANARSFTDIEHAIDWTTS